MLVEVMERNPDDNEMQTSPVTSSSSHLLPSPPPSLRASVFFSTSGFPSSFPSIDSQCTA